MICWLISHEWVLRQYEKRMLLLNGPLICFNIAYCTTHYTALHRVQNTEELGVYMQYIILQPTYKMTQRKPCSDVEQDMWRGRTG